jgi:hypothetical protein
MNSKLISAAVLLAGLAVTVSAQTVFNTGDLYLGVRSGVAGLSTGSGANDLIVDLGSASNFYTAVNGGFASGNPGGTDTALATAPTVHTWDLSTDLNSAFGINAWKTAGTAAFSIVGGDNLGNVSYDSIWVAAPNGGTLHVGTQPDQDTFAGTIQNYTANLSGSTLTGSSLNATIIAKSDPQSYTTTVKPGQPNSFGSKGGFYGVANIETDTASGTASNLWMLDPDLGNGTLAVNLGTFTLGSNGTLTFSVAAIPEPSTYAMILGAAALGFVMIRRRKQVLA